MQHESIFEEIEKLEDEMTQALMKLIRFPAISPDNDGEGESKKAEQLMQILETVGFERIERYDSKDERVPIKKRPNILAHYEGKDSRERLWIVTHLDIVPPGEESLWTITKPFNPVIKDGRVYGRGSEDNGQSMIASIYAVKALKRLEEEPKRNVTLAFVADEEQGSRHGIQHLIKLGLFNKEDLIVVPDSGNEKGDFIEIAEKSGLWFKVRTQGKQAHASRPQNGLNAHRLGMNHALALDKMLHEKYSAKDEYFNPSQSTFEITKKDKNIDALNIIPGDDVVYFDCRILPKYDLEEIVHNIQEFSKDFRIKTHAEIQIEVLRKSSAPKPTDANSRIVEMLKGAIENTRGVKPKVGGIGGGTCAAFFRRINIPAVVWSTIDEIAHQPNEYAKIENIVKDAKVFAYLAIA
ncbi:MAG: M20 family metallo-hydrolase [Candidatus Bathyarchaeota archaeon]